MKDTAPEINALLFSRMMQRSAIERLIMGMDMVATARALVWATIPMSLPETERRSTFYERFYGKPRPW